eukprot:Amastigsp_a511360_14.p3 type:complete len:139 gc:universal Amastigsp_a511360_14:440-856(+)
MATCGCTRSGTTAASLRVCWRGTAGARTSSLLSTGARSCSRQARMGVCLSAIRGVLRRPSSRILGSRSTSLPRGRCTIITFALRATARPCRCSICGAQASTRLRICRRLSLRAACMRRLRLGRTTGRLLRETSLRAAW